MHLTSCIVNTAVVGMGSTSTGNPETDHEIWTIGTCFCDFLSRAHLTHTHTHTYIYIYTFFFGASRIVGNFRFNYMVLLHIWVAGDEVLQTPEFKRYCKSIHRLPATPGRAPRPRWLLRSPPCAWTLAALPSYGNAQGPLAPQGACVMPQVFTTSFFRLVAIHLSLLLSYWWSC